MAVTLHLVHLQQRSVLKSLVTTNYDILTHDVV